MLLADVVFLLLLALAASTLMAAIWFFLRGESLRARTLLRRVLVGAGAYMGVVILVSWVAPRRILEQGATQCFDDWCITVSGLKEDPSPAGNAIHLDLRLSSRARRVSQRENNAVVYLTDDLDHRYDPQPDAEETPLNVLLAAGESVTISRSFLVPADARELGFVLAHEGGFPIGWFIIGYDTWFRKPTLVKLKVHGAH